MPAPPRIGGYNAGMKRRKRKASRIPLEEVESLLFGDGLALADYFLCSDSVMCWRRNWDNSVIPFAVLIDEDALAEACVNYLRGRGVAEYASRADIPKTPLAGSDQ
jgi:hypothetical protein